MKTYTFFISSRGVRPVVGTVSGVHVHDALPFWVWVADTPYPYAHFRRGGFTRLGGGFLTLPEGRG